MESGVTAQRKRRWKLPVFVLFLLVAFLVAPTLITKTSLLDRTVRWVAPALDGKLDIGSVRASWFSPVEIHQVRLRDLNGETLLDTELIRSERSLWRLVTNRHNVGRIQISSPEIHLRVDEHGSNVESLLAAVSTETTSDSRSSTPSAVQLQIDNGTLVIQDEVSGQQWQFSQLMLNYGMPSDIQQPLTGAIFSQVTDTQTSGKVSGQFQFIRAQPGAIPNIVDSPFPPSMGSGQLQLETKDFPLNLLNLALRRSQSVGAIVGHCDSKLDCHWGTLNGQAAASIVGSVQVSDAQAAFPEYFGDDQVVVQDATAIVDGRIENSLVTVSAVNLTMDHGRVRCTGSAPLSELTGADVLSTLLSPRSENQYQIEGRIDLAGLLATLPNTLQVRDGTTITSGAVQFNVSSSRNESQRQLSGTLDARDLAASRDGQSFRWSRPVQVDFQGVANEDGLVIEKATCNSDFLFAQASGQIHEGSLQASADLDRLVAELDQFFDLQGHQLAGSMDAAVQWRQVDSTNLMCTAKMQLSDFSFATPSSDTWTETMLSIDGSAEVTLDSNSIHGIQKGTVTVTSSADTLTATLVQPISDPAHASWPMTVTVQGEIQNWLTRARPWFPTDSWSATGNIRAEINGSFSPEFVAIEQSQATVHNLDFMHPSFRAQESVAQLQGVATWDGRTGQLMAPWFTLTGTTLALRGENFEIQTAGGSITANGQAAFRADIGKLYGWVQDPTQPQTARTTGIAEGRVQARAQGTKMAFNVHTTIRDFAYQQAVESSQNVALPNAALWSNVWAESNLTVTSTGQMELAEDRVVFESIKLGGESLQVDAAGQLTALSMGPRADFRGELTYDLQRIATQLQLGPEIQLFGRQTHPFAIQGPLSTAAVQVSQPVASASPLPSRTETTLASGQIIQPLIPHDLNARAIVGWESASIYGIPLGPGQLSAQLSQGVVMSSPLDIRVGPSQLRLAPTVHLNANPMTMVLEPGPLAQSVELTPQMCDTWLKYVAPVLSDAAVASGTFSVDLAGSQIPLTDPIHSSVGGRLTIHQARVQPGPLAGQLAGIADQVTQLIGEKKQNLDFLNSDTNWIEIRENEVDFQMQHGRVYHRNLNVDMRGVKISTEGWVGVDQTMSMIATIPILDEWAGGEPLLAGLKGQTISIPIRGTFDDPQVDRQVLSQFSKEFVGGAAQQYLQGELQKGLQKLLKGR